MKKPELLTWLREEYQRWQAFLEQIGLERMDQPGVNGDWSMKDLVAHMTVWNRRLVASIQAAQRGEPEPPPPWPEQLQTEDEVNAWIYEDNQGRPAGEVLDESQQVFLQLMAVIECLPDDVQIEKNEPAYHLVWVGDTRFPASEFFDHYRDEHEADVRAWLARIEKQQPG